MTHSATLPSGVSGLLAPLHAPGIRMLDLYVMLGTTAALLSLMWSGFVLKRREGAVLLAAYGGYISMCSGQRKIIRGLKAATPVRLARLAGRGAFFAALWWLLNGGDARSWGVGGPVVLAAAALSLWLQPGRTWRWRWAGVLPMAWFFLRQSVRGGFDVARRALRPSLPLRPGVLCFRTRLPGGSPRLLFAGLVSLLPGTLVMGLEDDTLQIHALDCGPGAETELRALEHRVARLFGVELRADAEVMP